MDITLSINPDTRQAQVIVTGELDIATAPELRRELTAAVTVYEEIAVDLGGLEFCDCSGIGALIAADNLARSFGHRLQLCRVPDHLRRLLRISRHRLTLADPSRPVRRPVSLLGAAGRSAA